MADDTKALPPPAPDGCLGKGCLIVIALAVLLMVALTLGAMWGVHYLRKTYSDTARMELQAPETTAAPTDQPSVAVNQTTEPAPDQLREVQARWEDFERAADRGQKARIQLTAAEINMLLEGDRELRGKARVSIENNVGRVRVSIPLGEMFMMEGRFLNGEASVHASPDGDPAKARITNVVLANQPVADEILDRRVFGWLPIRTLIQQWLEDHDVTSFRIENNAVIGETRGPRE